MFMQSSSNVHGACDSFLALVDQLLKNIVYMRNANCLHNLSHDKNIWIYNY